MTTDLAERERYWRRQYPYLTNWTRESTHNTKSSAQAEETRLALQRGCASGHGGDGREYDTWHVYSFSY